MAKQSIKNIWYEFLAAEDFFKRFDDSSDVIFELDDGSKWAVTFFTYKNIETIRKKNQLIGECLGGTYFCATDMVLILVHSAAGYPDKTLYLVMAFSVF